MQVNPNYGLPGKRAVQIYNKEVSNLMNINWNLRSVNTGQVDLSTEGSYQNVGSYTVPENKMLLITARLNYTRQEFAPPSSSAVETQSFASMVSSNFLRNGGVRYFDLEDGELTSANVERRDFNIKLMVKAEGGNHQLKVLLRSESSSPSNFTGGSFEKGNLALYRLNNSMTVQVFEVGVTAQAEVADVSVTSIKLADGAVTSGKIGANAVTFTNIEPGAVGELQLSPGAVGVGKVVLNAVESGNIADGAISSIHLAPGAITTGKIAPNAVESVNINPGAVTPGTIAPNAVGSIHIAPGAIVTGKIPESGIIETNIADGAVTTSKIADGAVTTPKLADGAVTQSKITDDSVGLAQLAHGMANKFLGFDENGIPVEKEAPVSSGSNTAAPGVLKGVATFPHQHQTEVTGYMQDVEMYPESEFTAGTRPLSLGTSRSFNWGNRLKNFGQTITPSFQATRPANTDTNTSYPITPNRTFFSLDGDFRIKWLVSPSVGFPSGSVRIGGERYLQFLVKVTAGADDVVIYRTEAAGFSGGFNVPHLKLETPILEFNSSDIYYLMWRMENGAFTNWRMSSFVELEKF